MAEKVEIELHVEGDGSAAKSVSNIKKELREAQAEALRLSREFGELSPQAVAAAKKVTGLKDEINDLNERVALFDPGAKFQAFGNVVTSVAGGFTAAQGAMALFGSESEDLQKQIVKLQGALALSQGLSTIADSWKDFQRLGTIIKTQVVTAFTTLKGALAATGIGLLVVAIGTLVTNFEKVEAWLKKIIPGFESFGAVFNKVKAIAFGAFNAITEGFKVVWDVVSNIFSGDFSAAADAARNAGSRIGAAYAEGFNEEVKSQAEDAARELIAARIQYQERELKVLQAGGEKRLKEAQALERKILEEKINAEKAGTQARFDAEAELRAFDAKAAVDREKAAEEAGKKAEEQRKARMEKLKQEQDAQLAVLKSAQQLEYQAAVVSGRNIYDLKLQQLNEQKELLVQQGRELKDIQFQIDMEMLEQRKALNTALADDVDIREGRMMAALQNSAAAQAQLAAQQIKNNEDLQRSDEARSAVKAATEQGMQMAMSSTADLSEAIAGLAGEQTAAGKALAIGATTIRTYESAMLAYRNGQMIGGPWGIAAGIIAAAAAVATGIANVKRITAVQIPGGGGGAASSISGVNSAPALPRVQADTGTMVDQLAQVNSNMRQATRVQVVESDITNVQNRVEVIESNAKF